MTLQLKPEEIFQIVKEYMKDNHKVEAVSYTYSIRAFDNQTIFEIHTEPIVKTVAIESVERNIEPNL